MKKILSLITLFILSLLLLGCNNSNSNKDKLDDEKNNMSYQALSSIKLLQAQEVKSQKLLKTRKLNTQDKTLADIDKYQDIEKYLEMMDELLNESKGFESKVEKSDKSEYSYMIIIITKDLKGEKVEYTLYYNEIFTKEEIDEDDKNEIEVEKTISGIAIVDGVEYKLEGKIKEEREDDELETESYYKIIEDKDNYVIVKEEKEEEKNETEHEYKYTIVKDGNKVNEFKLEVEQENNEMSIELKEESNNYKTSYKFKSVVENNVKYLEIEVKEDTKVTKLKVRCIYDVESGTYKYDYKSIN